MSHLVFGVDERIIDDFIVVTKSADGVDSDTGIQGLGGGHLTHALELQSAELHAESGDAVYIHLFLREETKNVEGFVHDLHFLFIIWKGGELLEFFYFKL